ERSACSRTARPEIENRRLRDPHPLAERRELRAFARDVSDAEEIGRAGRAEREARGDHDAIAQLGEPLCKSDLARALRNIIEVLRVLGFHAMQAPRELKPTRHLLDRR